MGQRVDFSRDAPAYDRRHGSFLSEHIARQLTATAGLQGDARILDVGAGTGRVAIPLASLGYRVTALDPAEAMLHALQKKDHAIVTRLAGEGGRLPFVDSSFDAVVLARILYLTHDWQNVLSEAVRVLRSPGFILHEWGNGSPEEEWVQIRERLRMLFEDAGIESPFHPGARTEAEVQAFFSSLGLEPGGDLWMGGELRLTLDDFLGRIADNEYSYTWNVPVEVQRHCLRELEQWAGERFDLSRSVPVPRDLGWRIYRKTGPHS
jgi:SAM-dependent methyltransferase